jgi:hypothetical protein
MRMSASFMSLQLLLLLLVLPLYNTYTVKAGSPNYEENFHQYMTANKQNSYSNLVKVKQVYTNGKKGRMSHSVP